MPVASTPLLVSLLRLLCSHLNLGGTRTRGEEARWRIEDVQIEKWLEGSDSHTHITMSLVHTHTVCTCWRRVVRTGSKHMPTERSSQTAGPATREKNPISTICWRKVCTNRKHQDYMHGRRKCWCGWQYQSSSPHLPEAPHRAHHRSWTENGWLWPALDGTYIHTYIHTINYCHMPVF